MYIRVLNGEIIMASKNCLNCGASLDLDAKFCSNCGTIQKTATPSLTTSPPSYNYANVPMGYNNPQPNPSIIQVMAIIEIVIGVLGTLGTIFVGYLLYYINKYGITNGYISIPYDSPMNMNTRYMISMNFINTIMLIILIIILLVSITTIVCGVGLYRFRNWGRIGSMVIGGISLISFPLGTAFCVAMLYLLTRSENIRLFTENNTISP